MCALTSKPPDPQTINLTAGEVQYTRPVTATEVFGKNITGIPIVGYIDPSMTTPTSSQITPDVVTYSTIYAKAYRAQGGFVPKIVPDTTLLYQVTMQILVSSSSNLRTPGSYYVLMKPTDSPETFIEFGLKLIII